jgi:hypothetical protein
MGKALQDPRKPLTRIKIGKRNNRALVALAGRLHAYISGNAAFTTPLPSLATLLSETTALTTAMALTNFKRNRGSHTELLSTINAASTLRNTITALVQYIIQTGVTTATDNIELAAILSSSGVAMRKIKVGRGPAQNVPTFVQQNNSRKHPANLLRLKWAKPLGNVKGQPIAGYNINVETATGIYKTVATTTATNYIFANPYPGVLVTPGVIQGQIVPFNSRGSGRPMFFTVRF